MSDGQQLNLDFQGSAEDSGMDEVKNKLLQASNANIKVFGIGGGGLNAVNNMIRSGLSGVEFFAANTDAQALVSSLPINKIRLGDDITKGLGAGADPEEGGEAATPAEDIDNAVKEAEEDGTPTGGDEDEAGGPDLFDDGEEGMPGPAEGEQEEAGGDEAAELAHG